MCEKYNYPAEDAAWELNLKNKMVVALRVENEQLKGSLTARDELLRRVLPLASVESPCPVCLSRQPCVCLTTLIADITALSGAEGPK